MRRTLDPKLDVVFKILFAHPDSRGCLISLLTSVLRPDKPIAEVEVLNPEIPKADTLDKGVVLDLRVRLVDGSQVDVEMQSERRPGFRKRALYYWAKMFTGQLSRGRQYARLKPAAVVVFTDYRELSSGRLHSCFQLLERSRHELFSDDLELHVVELKELPTMSQTEQQREGLLVWWSKFLAAASDDELEQAAREDEMINQAKEVLEDLSEDPEVRELASWREDHIKLDRMQRQMEMEEARTEGKAEGKAEGKRDMLLLLFERDGVTLNDTQQRQLESCADIEQLDRWIRQALDGASPDDILG